MVSHLEAQVRCQISPRGICGDKWLWHRFSPNSVLIPCQSYPTHPSYIYIIRSTLRDFSNQQRSYVHYKKLIIQNNDAQFAQQKVLGKRRIGVPEDTQQNGARSVSSYK